MMQTLNQQQLFVQALAFLIENIGYPVKAGKELFFPLKKLQGLSPYGEIQVETTAEGFHIRYTHNRTIDVEAIKDDDSSKSLRLAETENRD